MKKYLLIIIMIGIVCLSNTPELSVIRPETWLNEPKYEENVTNLNFLKDVGSTFYLPYDKEVWADIDFIMHKLSHIFFYSAFTYLLFINLSVKKLKCLITWLLVTIFALTDEIHQYFIVGRSGRLYDVILDSTASFLTLSIVIIILAFKKRKIKNSHKIDQISHA